jgi:cysteine-rich repeat protein
MICGGGSPITPDTCYERCGDGRNAGYFACDDGNVLNGDGCSSSCSLEKGFVCSGGTPYEKDVCDEVCGDGLNLGSYQCDDGNLLDGDGCS